MEPIYIGIDLGTSSVKAVGLSPAGVVVALAQVRYPLLRPRPGWAEQDASAWWRATQEAVGEVLAAGRFDVRAVALSGQMHGLVAVGKDARPVRPAIIWSDMRSAEQVAAWRALLDPSRVEFITGMPIAVGMLGVSLSWVKEHEPDVYDEISAVMLPKDYIRLLLTGVVAIEPTDAGGSLLFDIRHGVASADIMDAVGHPVRLLPDAGPTLGLAGRITREASRHTGIPADVPVAYGGGDQAMAALALGLTDRSRAAVAISSGGTIFKCTSAPLGPEHGLHVMPYVRPREWMAMGVVLAGGFAIDWLADRLLGKEPTSKRISALMSEANAVPKGAEGLVASPHLGGTRTPVVDEGARAHLSGLGFQHGQAHIARALVEGVCVALSSCLTSMQFAGDPAQELVVSGGGARFPLWRQTLADVTGLPVHVSSDLEHPALGAALAGAAAVSEPVAFTPATRIAMTIDPDPAAGGLYADIAKRLTRIEAAARQVDGS